MSRALVTPLVAGRRVPFALGLAMALIPVAALALTGAWADALADRVVSLLLSAQASVALAAQLPAQDEALSDTELGDGAFGARALAAPARAGRGARHGVRPAAHGIRISSAQVLGLAARNAMPGAVPVKASAQHSAGLQLRGVSALGVGLQDGDVLTEAGGQRASSVAGVVAVVLAARGRHSSEISGRFERAGVPYLLIVEQPYPPAT